MTDNFLLQFIFISLKKHICEFLFYLLDKLLSDYIVIEYCFPKSIECCICLCSGQHAKGTYKLDIYSSYSKWLQRVTTLRTFFICLRRRILSFLI